MPSYTALILGLDFAIFPYDVALFPNKSMQILLQYFVQNNGQKMAALNELRATYSVAISDLRKAPMKVIDAAGDSAVAVLNHNAPVAYVLSPKMMGELLDMAADKLVEQRAVDRVSTLKKAKPVSLAEL